MSSSQFSWVVAIFVWLISFSAVFGQERVFASRYYGLDEGLPHRNVTHLFFDRDGVGWAVTNFALTRIDGNTTKIYEREQLGDAVDNIQALAQDASGRLWLWGKKGCFIFDPATEVVVPARSIIDLPDLYFDTILQYPPKYPITHRDGSFLFNPGGIAILVTIATDGQASVSELDLPGPFQLLAITDQGKYWVRSADKVCLIEPDGRIITAQSHPGLDEVKPVRQTRDAFYYYTVVENEESPYGFFKQNIKGAISDLKERWELSTFRRVFFEAEADIFWVELADHWELRTTDGQLSRRIENRGTTAGTVRNLSNSWSSVTGPGNGLWITTETGINRVQSSLSPFTKHLDQDDFAGERRVSFRGIWAAKDTLYASGEVNGVFQKIGEDINILATEHQRYLAGRNIPETFNAELVSDFRGMYRDPQGYLWFGHQRVLLRYDPREQSYRKYPPAFSYSIEFGVNPWSFHQQEDGTIWVGLQPGLGKINPQGDSLTLVQPPEAYADLRESVVYSIYEAPNQDLWLCTDKGLYQLDEQGNFLARYWSGGEGTYLLPYDLLYHFYPAADGKFWLATAGNGLILFDPQNGIEQQWARKDGLSDQILYAVYEDEAQLLWLTSDYGIMRLDTAQNIITTWLPENGLPHHEYNRGAHFRADDGTFFFGSLNGIASFHPRDLDDWAPNTLPPIRLSRYRVWQEGQPRPEDRTAILLRDSIIELQPNDEHFYLEFSLIDYRSTPTQYAYRLGDGEWQNLSTNSLRSGRLPYGRYPIEIKAQLASGRWTEDTLLLTVAMIKPFYLRPTFWAFCFIGAILSAVLLTRIRTRQLILKQQVLEARIHEATAQIRKDKTLIEQQAKELQELDQVKTRFFANVSHELRTPLTLILGPIRSLLGQQGRQEKERMYLTLAEQNAKELLQKINTILDLAKLDAKGLELKTVPTQLYATIRRILGNFESRADLQNIKLSYDYIGDRSLSFEVDQDKLATILSNLLSNALKFTPSGGRILLSVVDATNALQLSVQDSGTGIPAEDLPFVFDRFYQAKQQEKAAGGSGIGLALCQELVQLHGGQIMVESKLGVGTTFQFTLPRREVLGVPNTGRPSHETKRAKQNGSAIQTSQDASIMEAASPYLLVVEDNSSMQAYLATILSSQFQVGTALNGRYALDILAQQDRQPDLIITDLMMPEVDGFELIEKIKEDPRLRRIPLIVLTARSSATDRLRALRFGVDDYVAKPFVEEELLARINRLLSNAQERAAFNQQKEDKIELPPQWLADLEQIVLQHLEDAQLSATFLADQSYLSVRQLQRRLKKEVGLPTGEYIREIRLNEALRLLETRELTTVKEVAYRVGFKRVEYFSNRFKDRFGRTPSSYL